MYASVQKILLHHRWRSHIISCCTGYFSIDPQSLEVITKKYRKITSMYTIQVPACKLYNLQNFRQFGCTGSGGCLLYFKKRRVLTPLLIAVPYEWLVSLKLRKKCHEYWMYSTSLSVHKKFVFSNSQHNAEGILFHNLILFTLSSSKH